MFDEIEKANELYDRDRAAFDRSAWEEAESLFRASVALAPHFKTLELLGETLFHRDQQMEAAIYLAASAGIAPNQYRARLLLAEVLLARGDQDAARLQLEEALRINPRFERARELLGRLPAAD